MASVKGEILIERQIRQLKESGIKDIFIITGYKSEQFGYLIQKFGVNLIHNPEYMTRNNNSSVYAAKNILRNSYVCSADNYFAVSPFTIENDSSYYAAVYSEGFTSEWCMTEDAEGFIDSVNIGGRNSWYMLGHTFWTEDFTEKFLRILEEEYFLPETHNKLWEKIFSEHLDVLKMKIRKYEPGIIFEFDSLDELRDFDESYRNNTRSAIIKKAAETLHVNESDIVNILPLKRADNSAEGFTFNCRGQTYSYLYESGLETTKGERLKHE